MHNPHSIVLDHHVLLSSSAVLACARSRQILGFEVPEQVLPVAPHKATSSTSSAAGGRDIRFTLQLRETITVHEGGPS